MTTKSSETVQTAPPKNIKMDDIAVKREREQQQELRRLIGIQAREQSDRL